MMASARACGSEQNTSRTTHAGGDVGFHNGLNGRQCWSGCGGFDASTVGHGGHSFVAHAAVGANDGLGGGCGDYGGCGSYPVGAHNLPAQGIGLGRNYSFQYGDLLACGIREFTNNCSNQVSQVGNSYPMYHGGSSMHIHGALPAPQPTCASSGSTHPTGPFMWVRSRGCDALNALSLKGFLYLQQANGRLLYVLTCAKSLSCFRCKWLRVHAAIYYGRIVRV